MEVRPMPTKYGVGFMSSTPLPDDAVKGYRYEQVGNHHNYHVTSERHSWPIKYQNDGVNRCIDAFSPNLNKILHVGHLRNLALAKALSDIFPQTKTTFVSMLGASIGVTLSGLESWEKWTKFVSYAPQVYYDCVLPQDVIKTRKVDDKEDPAFGAEVWDGPNGPVIVRRADGRPLYALHDLCFANFVKPTHYITGHEQKEHFESLGLGEKHHPMGLILGSDGKKMRSRTGDAVSAEEAMSELEDNLRDANLEGSKSTLAWNIMAWNCLQAKRDRNLQFEPQNWTKPDSAGMYITYTFARILSALETSYGNLRFVCGVMANGESKDLTIWRDMKDVREIDVRLAGIANQYSFYLNRAKETFDPSPIAQYAHDLARELGKAYHAETIKEGRREFVLSVMWACNKLGHCMRNLGMFPLEAV